MKIKLELDLAEVARERYALAEAEGRYTGVLSCLAPEDDGRRLVALRGRALVRYRAGRAAEAVTDFQAATATALRLGDGEAEVGLLLERATALDWLNDAAGAAGLVKEAAARSALVGVRTHAVRAALLVGQGRSLFRDCRWAESCVLLEEAVLEAEQLGAAGHESLVIALILLEVVLPYLGRLLDAEAAAHRAISLASARGDRLHLASALNNRRNLLIARRDGEAAIADQRAFGEIGRELGMALAEYYAEFNIAELQYQAGRLDTATPFARRAIAFEEQQPELAPRPVAALLEARMLLFQGLMAEARLVLERIRIQVAKARSEERAAGLFAPSEEVLEAMVDLSTRDSTMEEWSRLIERSTRDSIEQEPIEVMEAQALWALRRGRTEEAQRHFATALDLAARLPNLLEPRIRRALRSVHSPAN